MSAKNEIKILNIRFLEVLDALKDANIIDTQLEFAEKIGVEARVISDIKAVARDKTGTYLTAEHLYRSLIAYPVINERYILRGEEPKIFSEGFQIGQSEAINTPGLEERVKELEEMMKKLSNR
jgi:hypothetical protein